jgi:glycosyltransferase involved in cell wall biosynthesis
MTDGVLWLPFENARRETRGEVGIAVASSKAFRGTSFRAPILWLHNPTKSWRSIKRGEAFHTLKARAHLVTLGPYHSAHVPGWLPFRSRIEIAHGVGPEFFRKARAEAAPSPRVLFTSQPYRGLDWLLDLWPAVVASVPQAELHVFAPKAHQAEANARRNRINGVVYRGSVARAELVEELKNARLQFIPGHDHETFCLAAAEATAAGVPIMTRGIGALGERVNSGVTGFIEPTREGYIARTISLLQDDALWLRMHANCLAARDRTSWDERALEWEALFKPMIGEH